ncbi:ABC transporter ATP-binding protein [Chryseobacterium koreense]|uniref:ABC transporter ATP-binding protein n=1 Tax=Chryseobacterium koreense TaxID=232216 RepID=UPI0026EF129D|nr:ABC transporter ATP-binding protein [Chryseobacterium koreense]
MEKPNSIKAENLSKSYGGILAVDHISFDVNPGEIFGLIGPDGSGKTTIFRMLTTLLLADSGNATIAGLDVVKDYTEIRKIVGYMPGKFSLYPDLSVEENLQFFASVFNTKIQENYNLIKEIYIQLEPFKNRRAGKLSGGMKQKLALCCALIHQPKVLFLDEPTTGVDPVSRKEFWEMLKSLKEKNITILVATPYMDEAEMCDRILLIQNGKILKTEAPEKISEDFPHQIFEVKAGRNSNLLRVLEQYPEKFNAYAFGEFTHLVIEKGKSLDEDSFRGYLKKIGFNEIEIHPVKATIEDSFILLLSSNS